MASDSVLTKASQVGGLPGDTSMGPLTGCSNVRKRKRKSGSGTKQVKKAKKCKGLESHTVAALNSAMQTLEACYEIMESEELWNLLEKLEATLHELRLRREKENTSSPTEIEDDDPVEDLIDSLASDQNNIASEKSASPDSSVKDITGVNVASQSNHESEQTDSVLSASEIQTDAISSPSNDNVACTDKETIGASMSDLDSSVNNTLHEEAPIEPFSNLPMPDNVPAKDKIALDLQLSMLKSGSKAVVMFLKCPFDENMLLGLESSLKIIQVSLTPEFDEYFGTKPRELIQAVSNFVSRIQTLLFQYFTAEAELIYQKQIEKCKDAVKCAEEYLCSSLNTAIKACEKSTRSKEKFRDALLYLCIGAERLECALKRCMSKKARRRDLFGDYVTKAQIVEVSREDLASAEKRRATEVPCISEEILEERKQPLLKEAEALLARMMS